MKKSFLNSLIGKEVSVAEDIVIKNNYKPWIVPDGSPISAVSYNNVVILWERNNKIISANACNVFEEELD